MRIIDTHQHYWVYNAEKHSWINDEMQVIRKDFLPKDLETVLQQNNVEGCVAVEADQSEKETEFLLQAAKENSFIKGVVGYVDLRADNVEERLQYFQQFKSLKGFRHVLQSEAPEFMLQKNFLNGISLLSTYNFTYDVLIFPHHLEAALQLVQSYPNQKFVIDHLAKPYIKKGEIEPWAKAMQQMAQHENVYCKISGMVTEADWQHWTYEDLKPYFGAVVNAFGSKRIMFGSDWPVCLVASSYDKWLQTVKYYFSSFSSDEQQDFFANNAVRFYNL